MSTAVSPPPLGEVRVGADDAGKPPSPRLLGVLLLFFISSIGAQSPNPDNSITRLLVEPQRCSERAVLDTRSPLPIDAVVRAAICNNALVRQGDGLATQAQAALDRARGLRQPSLTLSAGVDAERGVSTDWAVSLRLDWVLFDFGSRSATLQQARMALGAVLAEQSTEVLTAIAQAAQLFTAAQAAHGLLDAAGANLRTAQDSAQAVEARHAAGAATLAEKLQGQTALAQARLEHARAKGQWLSAQGTLASAIGLATTQPIEVAAADTDDQALLDQVVDIDALIEEARQVHPRLAAARSRMAEAQQRAAAVGAERWGSFTLSGQTGRSRSSSDSVVSGTNSASVFWTLPLFDRGSVASRLHDAQGLIQQRAAGAADAARQVELQVWQQAQALLSERDGMRESRLVLDSAETLLRVVSERYRLGVGSFTDVLTAQGLAATARFQWVEARANLHQAQWRLAAALGRWGLPPL
jgi:outer membrane protein